MKFVKKNNNKISILKFMKSLHGLMVCLCVHISMFLQIQQLQKKDSQLKALDAFYKEQLAQLEKKVKGLSIYSNTSQDFLNL